MMLKQLRRSVAPNSITQPDGLLVVRAPHEENRAVAFVDLSQAADRVFVEGIVGHLPRAADAAGPPLAGTAALVLTQEVSERAGFGGRMDFHPLTDDVRTWATGRGLTPKAGSARMLELSAGTQITVAPQRRRSPLSTER